MINPLFASRTSLSCLLVASLGAAACAKTETSSSGSAAKGAGAAGAVAPGAGPDYAAWDLPGKAKAWQGSWLVKENGTIQAWTITGDQVETWDGSTAKTYTLKVTSPCAASLVGASGISFPFNFTVDAGVPQKRDGAGYRRGAEALFCDPAGDVYVLDAAGACTLWQRDRASFDDKLTKTTGTCGLRTNAKGAEVFFHEGTNGGEFEVRGDAILARSSFETVRVEGDHAAAKAARDARDASK